MKIFFILPTIVATALGLLLSEEELQQWEDFKVSYGKTYASKAEEEKRMEIFAKNLRESAEHNKKYEAGLVLYTKGVTQFADLTQEEFQAMFPPLNLPEQPEGIPFAADTKIPIPDSIDWRDMGAVTAVKDQQQCRSCYTFSATGALEGQLFRKTGRLVSLSEQNLVDCSTTYGNHGCEGGWPSDCFRYIQSNGGIDTEDSYPYEAKDGQCRYNPEYSAGTVEDIMSITSGKEDELKMGIAQYGPMSAAIDCTPLQTYTGGIAHGPCNATNINHGVLVVGYGSENGEDYWIVKNSWGEGFGENGYARMPRNRNNRCGIASYATIPIV